MALEDFRVQFLNYLGESGSFVPAAPQALIGQQFTNDLIAGKLPITDRRHQIVFTDKTEFHCNPFKSPIFCILAKIEVEAPELFLANFPAQSHASLAFLCLDPARILFRARVL